MKPEIGPIDLDAHLTHARVERVGRNRIGGLRRALQVDFAVTRKMGIGADIALSQKREPALARREARFRYVEILALPVGNEVVNRSGIGCEITGPVDVGEVDPATERQRDAFVADLADGTGIESRLRCLICPLLLDDGLGLFLLLSLLASLNLHALFELFQLGLE